MKTMALICTVLICLLSCTGDSNTDQKTSPAVSLQAGQLVTLMPTLSKWYQSPRTLIMTSVGTFIIIGETSAVMGSEVNIHKTNKNSILCITDTPIDKRCYEVIGL